MVFSHYLENCLSLSFYISHGDGFGKNTIPDIFKFTWSKVKVSWFTFVISYVNSFY